MRRTLALLALAMTWGASVARAQPPPEPPPTVITLRPAAQPDPALKYRLVPEFSAASRENAANFYYRACIILLGHRANIASRPNEAWNKKFADVEMKVSDWNSVPLNEIPREEARERLALFETALKEAELGAACLSCDWQFDRRREGISLLLPEIQEMRSLLRLVAVKARLAILDGKLDEAMHWAQVGLAMARHVSEGPTVIQALVGIAIQAVMERCLEDLIQAPGMPSLYWALADRPRPFIELGRALDGEHHLLERTLVQLGELDRGPWSVEQARRFVDEFQAKFFGTFADFGIPLNQALMAMNRTSSTRRLGITLMATKVYPEARRSLIAAGRPEAEVDAMPVVQVALLHSLTESRRETDDFAKWARMPYWQASAGLAAAERAHQGEPPSNPILALFRMLNPALSAFRQASARAERQLDALQCIEAIRLHAAAHGGTLPATLEGIADAPAPIDPALGKPFTYKVDGDTATLTSPRPPGFQDHPTSRINYVLKLAK